MIVTVVSIKVKKAHIDGFIEATLENHRHSIKEEGNLRFDVLQSKEHPDCFTLYEAYASEAAAAAHKNTAHYLKWKEQVADWMAEPRVGVAHSVLAPLGKENW